MFKKIGKFQKSFNSFSVKIKNSISILSGYHIHHHHNHSHIH